MITSNTRYRFGGKVAVVETPTFCCMISTAKEGFFKKQSVVFVDCTQGMNERRPLAKLLYNETLASSTRLNLHDVLAHTLDQAGMSGKPLLEALRALFAGLEAEGVAVGSVIDENVA